MSVIIKKIIFVIATTTSFFSQPIFAQSIKELERDCGSNKAIACAILGDKFQDGDGVRSNKSKAAELYKKGCDGGFLASCTNLGLLVEWHPKLSHFEENLHPNLSHPNRLSCLIFEQGWARSDQRGNFEQITQTCPSRQGLHPAS